MKAVDQNHFLLSQFAIKDEQGKEEEHKAMSYKKLLKKLSSNYKDQSVVKISYTNKKNHKLIKFIKVKKSDWHT